MQHSACSGSSLSSDLQCGVLVSACAIVLIFVASDHPVSVLVDSECDLFLSLCRTIESRVYCDKALSASSVLGVLETIENSLCFLSLFLLGSIVF